MDKILQDAKDVHVTAVIVYGKTTNDTKLYVDSDFSAQVDQAVVEDAFAKGVLMVKIGTASYRPVKVDGNKVTIAELAGSPAAATITEYTAKAAG